MWTIEEIIKHSNSVHALINDRWVPARPLLGPWITQLRDAWEVLRGRADAFKWPEGQ